MVGTRLGPELEERLDAISSKTGRSKSYYVRQAVEGSIEDWEDEAAAIEALKKPGRRWSLEEMINGDDLKADDVEG